MHCKARAPPEECGTFYLIKKYNPTYSLPFGWNLHEGSICHLALKISGGQEAQPSRKLLVFLSEGS
jgi:hypothetical protein